MDGDKFDAGIPKYSKEDEFVDVSLPSTRTKKSYVFKKMDVNGISINFLAKNMRTSKKNLFIMFYNKIKGGVG